MVGIRNNKALGCAINFNYRYRYPVTAIKIGKKN